VCVIPLFFFWDVSQEIEASGSLNMLEDFTRSVMLTVIKFLVIVIIFAGTIYILEVLGDPLSLTANYPKLETSMGSIDFYTVCYYTFVTISTVGYGDFSPRTLMGRIFVVFVILGGVAFFSVETGNFINILKLAAMGKGTFTARNNKRRHVLVCGGGITSGPLAGIETFLLSLTHASHGDDVPEVLSCSNISSAICVFKYVNTYV
jgi:potassium large conductance calcium-activated channel subfamily M alpha protein 1